MQHADAATAAYVLPVASRLESATRRDRPGIIVWAIAGIGLVLLATWFAFLLHLNLAAAGFVQLLIVLGVALKAGFWQATLVSIVANLCLNFFLIPPIFTFYVPHPEDAVALIVFEISALVVSHLSTQARAQAARAKSNEHELQRLYEFSRMLLASDRTQTTGCEILLLVTRIPGIESAVLFDAVKAKVQSIGTDLRTLEADTRSAYMRDMNVESTDGRTWIRVLRLGVRAVGSIGLEGQSITANTANAIASLTAIALERANSFEREMRAEAESQSEQLRTTVLDALAHEYKTPLTAVRTAASGLIEMGQLTPAQSVLVCLIDSEAKRLSELTTHLLRTSRLDRTDVRIRPERIDIDTLVQTLVSALRVQSPRRDIQINGLGSRAGIRADRELVQMALLQYLDNARKYSDPDSTITVGIEVVAGAVRVGVHTEGSPIPAGDRERIFERFHRGSKSSHRAAGTGIGLSVTKKVALAHQGRAWVASKEGNGNTFFLELPRLKAERI